MRSVFKLILLKCYIILNFSFINFSFADNHNIYEVLESIKSDLKTLERNPALLKRLKAVRKALAYLETNPRHPSLKQARKSSAFSSGQSLTDLESSA